ncbi:hypothetical protein D046_5100B, partial [Vibrio parahaemolyticus V-223/04]
IKTYKCFICE